MSMFEEVGPKMVNEDKFPLLSAWIQEFADSPHRDKMTTKFQGLHDAKLVGASPHLKKLFGVHEYVIIHINMCLSAIELKFPIQNTFIIVLNSTSRRLNY